MVPAEQAEFPGPGAEAGTLVNAEVEALKAALKSAEEAASAARDAQLRALAELDNVRTVSYTHLTLPTIYSV